MYCGCCCGCGSDCAGAVDEVGASPALRAAEDAKAPAGNDGGIVTGIDTTGAGAAGRSAARGESGSPNVDTPTSDASCCGSHVLKGVGIGVCTAAASAALAPTPLACHCASRCSSTSTRRRNPAIHTSAITNPTGNASSNSTTNPIIASNVFPLIRHPADSSVAMLLGAPTKVGRAPRLCGQRTALAGSPSSASASAKRQQQRYQVVQPIGGDRA